MESFDVQVFPLEFDFLSTVSSSLLIVSLNCFENGGLLEDTGDVVALLFVVSSFPEVLPAFLSFGLVLIFEEGGNCLAGGRADLPKL